MMRRFEANRDFAPLRTREYDVLFNLARLGGQARQWELNESLLISQPSLSRMIDRLQAAGYLERQESPSDRREVIVALTDKGARLQAQIGRTHVRHVAAIVDSALTEDEQKQLAALATKLRTGAEALR